MPEHIPPTYLSNKNAHERDDNISFEEGPHIYTVCGDRGGYTSVTTWNHSHFSAFDADGAIEKIMKSRRKNDPSYKYYGMNEAAIKQMWEDKRDSAACAGTNMHNDIEYFYNKEPVTNDSVEFQYFKNFLKDFPDLKPYRTEWMVYYEELKMSGSIDMLFQNEKGEFLIYDWKRCNEIPHECPYGKFAVTPCISHLPDTKFWHYALQLNIYKMFLEHKYDKKVVGMFLICLHP